jgi:collagenase-like PrtC family protease
MKFTVGYNWDTYLFDKIQYKEVESVYSGLGKSVIGEGRAPLVIKDIDEKTIKKHIDLAHKKGLEFDFTINTGCTSNKEFTKEGHKEVLKYIEWVSDLGVDSVTVALPSLVSIVKKHFPHLKVKISTFQRITSVPMAKRFEDMGADTIMICEHSNRDFELRQSLRDAVI